MDWTILGISPTKDKKAITAAYRSRLASVNPEDKPEEFKALRGAYEEALRLADQEEQRPERDDSPVGQWMERVRALYDNYSARIRPENWAELLADEVCLSLDSHALAEDALLKFLQEDFYIPQSVWNTLDEAFSWSERREELYENYPRDFVDYAVMNGIHYPSSLPYELFLPGENAKDCDQYRRLYYRANQGEWEEIGPLLEQMTALSEEHPYGHVLNCRFLIGNGQEEQGREGLRELSRAYPDDITVNLNWAAQCAAVEDWEQCEGLNRHILEQNPNHRGTKRMLVDCLAHMDRQEEAKRLLFELMHDAGGDQKELYYLEQTMMELNQTLIGRWEEALAQDPKDGKAALELSWCYLQNDRDDDALAVCQKIDPQYEDQYSYHNLYAKILYSRRDFEPALEHLQAVEAILTDPAYQENDENTGRVRRLPEMLQLEGNCLYAMERREEALEQYRRAMELAPNDPEILTQTAHLLFAEHDFEKAVPVLTKVTELLPGSYHGYYLLSRALFELHRDGDAFDAINRTLELEGGDLGVYVLKMRILIRNGVWDEVREILDFLHENGIKDELSVLWCEALLTEFEQENLEQALEQYRAIAKRVEEGEELPWASQLYFRITVLEAEGRDARNPEDRAELMAILDKGLAHDGDDMNCLDYKAWLLKQEGRVDESLALYHKLEAMPHHSLNVERELAALYYKDRVHFADRALHYYRLVLEQEETSALHFFAAFCCRYMSDWEGAEYHFRRELEVEPDDVDAYMGLAVVCRSTGRFEEALAYADKILDLEKDRDCDKAAGYFRKIQILRCLNRPYEAVKLVDEVTEKCGYDRAGEFGYGSPEKLKFDLLVQFGLWEDARRHLDEWKRSKQQPAALAEARIRLDQLLGQYDKARFALTMGKRKLNSDDYWDLRLVMDELDGDIAGHRRDWKEVWGESEEYSDYALLNLAKIYWWDGNQSKARDYAQQALEKVEERLKLFSREEAMYRTRRSCLLAILGREEEARAELAKCRTLSLCEHCVYCSCKDADIFEAELEEIFGNYERAAELYRAGQERWPDEIDFAIGLRRLQRRGILP